MDLYFLGKSFSSARRISFSLSYKEIPIGSNSLRSVCLKDIIVLPSFEVMFSLGIKSRLTVWNVDASPDW